MKRTIKKLRPSQVGTDQRFNRELNEPRARRMAAKLNLDTIGVPVVSERKDGSFIAIDGQHRNAALRFAKNDTPRDYEVFEGLTLEEESELFLQLNSGRAAPGSYDHYRACLVAKRPFDMQIEKIVRAHGLHVTPNTAKGGVRAVQALRAAHKSGNLSVVLQVLCGWVPGLDEPACFDRAIIMAMSGCLIAFPRMDPAMMIRRMGPQPPESVLNTIKRNSRRDGQQYVEAGTYVLRDIYNTGTPKRLKLRKAA